jgi:D-lactate dehydrogenase
LGVKLGDTPEEMLGTLERGKFEVADIECDSSRQGSDRDYIRRVREIDSSSPARFNADPQRLFEASGSAGRIALFAVRLDTFPKEHNTRVFYVGTRDPAELTALRRHILSRFANLPEAGEYLHQDMFDVAETYGKDAFLLIRCLGTSRLPGFFALKRKFDSFASRLGFALGSSDRWLQRLSQLVPSHLPRRMKAFRTRFEHHLILKMAGPGIAEAEEYLKSVFPSPTGDYFECTAEEGEKAFLHRFVAAGAAIRYQAIHSSQVEEILALDIALKRNDPNWFETLPSSLRSQILHALYYGHFFCHVFHQDYIVRKGSDATALKARLLALLDARGAEYPAEHNVGHLYEAKPTLASHYRALDPCNIFNPGIGRTSKLQNWS